jgi:hypothetical protein
MKGQSSSDRVREPTKASVPGRTPDGPMALAMDSKDVFRKPVGQYV